MNQKSNKIVAFVGFVLATLCASPSFADVHWKHIVGVITASDDPTTDAAENINVPVGSVKSASFAWVARDGHARVDLNTGRTDFEVHGLVIIGQAFSGTTGPVQTVTGTVVCNPGQQGSEATFDTSDVPIDSNGNARFTGTIPGIPAVCANPVFLIRIANLSIPENPGQARGFWIATGTEPVSRP
jgi:hypothetical protein